MNEMHGQLVWQILGWVAFALNVWGNLALTTKGLRGWIIRIFSNACWMPYGLATGAWALTANHLLFAGINVYGWVKWKREADAFAKVTTPGETPPTTDAEMRRRAAYAEGWNAGRMSMQVRP